MWLSEDIPEEIEGQRKDQRSVKQAGLKWLF